MWQILKERFQHVLPMSISKRVLDATKIKLSDCKNIDEYTSAYREAYDNVYSLITKDSELTAEGARMILQAAFLTNMGLKHAGIASTIESEWKTGTTNLERTILRLIKFEEMQKGGSKAKEQLSQPTIFLSSSNSSKLRAPKGTCTNPECVKKGITSHYINKCFLKYPELCPRPKYLLRQMRPKGSKTNF